MTRTALPELRAAGLPARAGIALGCDYNPEQWAPEVWAQDVRLMREAGVGIVAINVFGWSRLEPRPGDFDFTELDEIMDLLDAAGIAVNLGNGTASPPPWLTRLHPEILPVGKDGMRYWPGGRQAWCPSSPVFREYARRLTTAVATRYGEHPALRLWHVSNELGCHNAACFCDVSAQAFRGWLQRRYGDVAALNRAWGTSVWSQQYGNWDEVLPPRQTLSAGNPTQALDFARFSSDELLEVFRSEAAVLRGLSDRPVTTNFMVTAHIRSQNYWQWVDDVDLVANDHYLDHRLAAPHQELAFAADLTRGLAGGRPWMLMEQASGAVNWQPRNLSKAPGEMLRNSLTHVARGADGICFFQWRASAQGVEKFHSGLVPHAGTTSRKWHEVIELGHALDTLAPVTGSRVVADVAILFSWEAWWACDMDSRPSEDVRYLDQVHRMYRAMWEVGITTDVVEPSADLSAYRLVLVPCLYLVSDSAAEAVARFVADGGTAVISFFSGIVDQDDRIRLGGYPGAFRELLGIRVDEFFPLAAGESITLDDDSTASMWAEHIVLAGATAVTSFTDGPVPGDPAVTRHDVGHGHAWYLGTALDPACLRTLLGAVADQAHISTRGGDGVEIVTRRSDEADYVFFINHGELAVTAPAAGVELLSGQHLTGEVLIPAGSVRVVRSAPHSTSRGSVVSP